MLGALIVALGARASADTYFVPPTPVPVWLAAGQQVISVNAEVVRSFPAQRAYIQLAVVGTPTFVATPAPNVGATLVKPPVEDPTSPPLRPLQPVTQADVDKARDALIQGGVPDGTITTAILPAAQHNSIGRVLVSVAPVTAQQFDRLAHAVFEVTKRFPEIRLAGTVLERERCDAQRATASAALAAADARATILANASGVRAGPPIRSDAWYGADSPFAFQLLCAGQHPRMPPAEVWSGGLPNAPYDVMDNRGVLYDFRTASKSPMRSVHFEHTQNSADIGALFAHQFRIPWNEPFVGAFGQFKTAVRPDFVVAVFSVSQAPGGEVARATWGDVDRAIRHSKIGVSDIMRTDTQLYARMPSYSAFLSLQHATADLPARYASADLHVAGVPILVKCDAVRTAVASQAFAAARSRALAMAAAAHVRLGPLFAVNDAGETVQTLCGYTARSPMSDIVRAIAQHAANFTDSHAVFSTALAAAWHLNVPASRRGSAGPNAPPYPASPAYAPFSTPGDGAYGSGTTMQAATADALRQVPSLPLQALIDQGPGYGPQYTGAFVQRVLAVYGT